MEETFHDYTYAEALSQKVNAIIEWVDKLVEWLKPKLEVIYNWMRKLYDLFYQAYLEDGAKFGESHEGMMMWFEAKSAENQRKQETEARGMGYGQEVPLEYLLYLDGKLKRKLN